MVGNGYMQIQCNKVIIADYLNMYNCGKYNIKSNESKNIKRDAKFKKILLYGITEEI